MQDEKQLVRRWQQGERKAFEEFVDAYGARVHRLVRRHIVNPTDAEDVTQEIFCDLHRSIGSFKGQSALSTWVYRVAVNHCLRHCQRRKGDHLPLDEQILPDSDWHADPSEAFSQRELSEQIQSALHQLSPGHASVVVLCELQGLSYQECAQILAIPVGTVKSRMFTAFRRLRDLLKGYIEQTEQTEQTDAPPAKEQTREPTKERTKKRTIDSTKERNRGKAKDVIAKRSGIEEQRHGADMQAQETAAVWKQTSSLSDAHGPVERATGAQEETTL